MSKKITSGVATSSPGLDEGEFAGFVQRMQSRFEANLAAGGNALFTTDCGDDNSLFELYLDLLPDHRQYHTCWCCKRFIVNYGSWLRSMIAAALCRCFGTRTIRRSLRVVVDALSNTLRRFALRACSCCGRHLRQPGDW